MLKIKQKIIFKHSENLMRHEGDVKGSIDHIKKNKNLYFIKRTISLDE